MIQSELQQKDFYARIERIAKRGNGLAALWLEDQKFC